MPKNSAILSSALPVGYMLRDTYTIHSVLGQGGFGITYLAEEDVTERHVVIKENYPSAYSVRHTGSLTAGADGTANLEFYDWALNSFLNEAKVLTRLKHPHIVPVLTAFKALGTAYYVMDHINGKPLHECAPPANSMTEDWLLPVLRKLLEALDYLHSQNLLHRDIKPANILMTPEGEPILIDFGAARLIIATHTHSRVGTPGYSPPEQMSTKATPGPWTDFYSLAATCYRLITGENPPDFTDRMFDDPSTTLLATRTELHGRFSPALLSSIDKAFAINPTERWQSAKEWLNELNGTSATTAPAPITVTAPAPLTVSKPQQTSQTPTQQQEARQRLKEQNITPDAYNNTLIEAAKDGKTELVSLLISAGADVNLADNEGQTPLLMAADNGHNDCVKLLLNAPGIDVSQWPPLALAVINNNIERLSQLLRDPHINVNKAAMEGKTALHWAAQYGHSECMKLLLNAPDINVNIVNKWGETPLLLSTFYGQTECIKQLLATADIDVNIANNKDQVTPLMIAVWKNRCEHVKLLLATPNINVNLAQKDGITPLRWAAYSGQIECIKLLLATPGIDVNLADKDNITPLGGAAYNGHSYCVELLLAAPEINVNKESIWGETPLDRAVGCGHKECARLLLAAGGKRGSCWKFSLEDWRKIIASRK